MNDPLIERMTEIAHRDSAVSVTVRADDLRALLSKLRATVADERAAVQHHIDMVKAYGDQLYCKASASSPVDKKSWGQTAERVLSNIAESYRAALASAHAAPQSCPTDVCQAGKADGVLCANDECDRANGVRPASAPVAGEAAYYAVMHGQALYGIFASEAAAEACKEQGHPDAPFSVKPLYAAPQSSEAVTLTGINADRLRAIASSGSLTAMSNALLNVARRLGSQDSKAVCNASNAFDDWLATHCDSDDLEAYEVKLARDAWCAALSAQPGAQIKENDS